MVITQKSALEKGKTVADPMLTIAVAGSAEVSAEVISDLLGDFLLLDTDEEKEFSFYLPADRVLTSKAVLDVAEWCAENRIGYIAITCHSPGRRGRLVLEDAEDVSEYEDQPIAEAIIDVLTESRLDDCDPVLIVAWGEDDEGPDEATRELVELAFEADIPVLDLSNGLIPLGDEPRDESDEAPAEEDSAPEPVAESTSELEELTEPLFELDEAQAATPAAGEIEEQPEVPDLVQTLRLALDYVQAVDRMNAAKNGSAEVRWSPLTEALQHHSRALSVPGVETEAALAVEEPKRRGKPRDIGSDKVVVYVHEGNRTARIVEGRGRPRKGEERREMLRSEYEAMVGGNGGYTPF